MILETIDAIPRHLVMPQQTEMIFTTICGVGLILSLVYMALQIRKRGDLVPLYAYVGAALAFLYEPFADYMVLVYFPEQGQLTAIDVVDRRVPWFMFFSYVWYIAPFAVFFLNWVEKGITRSAWWGLFVLALVLGTLFEELGIYLGLWTYYGEQPFRLLGLPLWIPFGFMCFVYGYAALVHGVVNNLPKNVHWIIAPAGPLTISGVHVATALPATSALYSTSDTVWLYVWATVSILLSMMFLWVLSLLYVKD